MTTVMWFRRDLRIVDNKALARAFQDSEDVLCVFHLNPEQLTQEYSSSQSAFLQSVEHLRQSLAKEGIQLYLLYGELEESFDQLRQVLPNWTDVYFNYDEAGYGRLRDQRAATYFRTHGIKIHAFQDHYLHGSQDVKNQFGKAYKVFTPYYRVWRALPKEKPVSVDLSFARTIELNQDPETLKIFNRLWEPLSFYHPGTEVALTKLDSFIADKLENYQVQRDYPSINGTSQLSSHLRTGEISIRMVFDAIIHYIPSDAQETFIKELAWRDFYNMVYVENPRQKGEAIQSQYKDIEWDNSLDLFNLWKKGETGFPIVDAAMRQLNTTGWMHNRLRMITASFLTKDLLIDWRWGERYFQQMLIDYDPASNIGGWQWVASTGTDAAPYFRIFNPTTQSERYDPEGEFIKHYRPQLADVPKKWLHEPARMPLNIQETSHCIIGQDYPVPIVDHKIQRQIAIERYKAASKSEDNFIS